MKLAFRGQHLVRTSASQHCPLDSKWQVLTGGTPDDMGFAVLIDNRDGGTALHSLQRFRLDPEHAEVNATIARIAHLPKGSPLT